jgi:hypothetical protein
VEAERELTREHIPQEVVGPAERMREFHPRRLHRLRHPLNRSKPLFASRLANGGKRKAFLKVTKKDKFYG